jgi:ATP-dependent Clp protease ATP-binding subunit ClpB
MNDKNNTKSKLAEIENELNALQLTRNALLERWENEKKYIAEIRTIKAEIEQIKSQAENFERESNLGKVAELRYGILPNLEKKLNDANDKLVELQKKSILNNKKTLLKEEVDAEDIATVIAKSTGIPVQKLLETERTKLMTMEKRIEQRIIGQDEVVSTVCNAIRRSRAGLQDVNRPLGTFIFLGTTGVGKTEMALALAEFLFDDENSIIRIDMSEYMEKHSVSRLVGAPPGYVGYEEGGQLTETVRRQPYSVLLFDEIEKAHKDVFNLLLQVFDTGRLTDSKGRTVNFKNTIIIMTSNIGTEIIQSFDETVDKKFMTVSEEINELLKQYFRPEFINRIDEIAIFKPLNKDEILQIAKLQIAKLSKLLSKQGFILEISDRALARISELGYDSQYGARPLRRAIQKHIIDKLSSKIISAEYVNGDKIMIDVDAAGDFIFNKFLENGLIQIPQ